MTTDTTSDRPLPEWDVNNQRFRMPERCPHPDCMAAVSLPKVLPALGWCETCGRPFEVIRIKPSPDAMPIDLLRRSRSAHCTRTRRLLTGYSRLDWCEAGGEPGRSHCLEDPAGALFGSPDPGRRRTIELFEAWVQPSLAGSDRGYDEEHVSSISVVRGHVIAVTTQGRIGIFDAESGKSRLDLPLEWPGGSADARDRERRVLRAPAFRGTWMALAAPHQAQFRDLKPCLFGRQGAPSALHVVSPDRREDQTLQFLGPPLGIDPPEAADGPTEGGGPSFFALLQGSPREEDGALRFFTLEGTEVARCATPGIARPPLLDRVRGRVIWVSRRGAISTVSVDQIRRGGELRAQTFLPDREIEIAREERPTFVLARSDRNQDELWLSSDQEEEGRTALFHVALELAAGGAPGWSWQKESLGQLGTVHGIAVGCGASHLNRVGDLLAVTTTQQSRSLRRRPFSPNTYAVEGHEGQGIRGSYDPPILCSAGVVSRLQGFLCLDTQLTEWGDEIHRKVPVPGQYDNAQGIAMFGRRIYIGHGLGVRSYLLRVEDR